MAKFYILRNLIIKHKYKLFITYFLFSIETAGSLLRFYFLGEAVNDLIKGSYRGTIILAGVHLVYLIAGTIRHIYDTRTYTAIYTSLVTHLLTRNSFKKKDISKLSAHSTLAREFVDFLEQDLVYVIEAIYNLVGSLLILMFYDKYIVLTCLLILVPVTWMSFRYGKNMNRLTQNKNDELEKQVDIIGTGNNRLIHQHYNQLRKWQIKISNKEAINFGLMEVMVLILITATLILSKSLHNPAMLAGSLFGIYSYIMKFSSGLDTIPYIIQRLSSVGDITRRIELFEPVQAEPASNTNNDTEVYPYRIAGSINEPFKISA